MMNWIPKAIAILAMATWLSGISPLVYAQRSPQTQTLPAPARPELDLLSKAVTNFFRTQSYETESEMQFNITGNKVNVTYSWDVKTIVKSPNLFRSEIVLPDFETEELKKYIIVSNGQQVWTYAPDRKQYAVNDYSTFDRSNDSILMGVVSSFFVNVLPNIRATMPPELFTEPNISRTFREMIESSNVPIKIEMLTVEGKQYYVYELPDPQKEYTFTLFVTPETASLERVKLSGKMRNMDLVITEKIIRKTENPVTTNDTFKFSPPPEITKVDAIRIQPF